MTSPRAASLGKARSPVGLLLLGIFVGLLALTHGAPGDLDQGFGTQGKVIHGALFGDLHFQAVAAHNDLVVVAGLTEGTFGRNAVLARYLPNGQPDQSFGINGLVVAHFTDPYPNPIEGFFGLAVLPDGGILAVGPLGAGPTGTEDWLLARYTVHGDLDTSFGVGGKVTLDFAGGTDVAHALVVQADGKIVVGGQAASGPTPDDVDFALARFDATGVIDATFGNGGKVTTDFSGFFDGAFALALQADGKIVAAGVAEHGTDNDLADFALARFTPAGSLDTAFGSGGRVTTDFGGFADSAADVALQPERDEIVVVGTTRTSEGDSNFAMARYTPIGLLDTRLDADGLVTTDFGGADSAVAVGFLERGKIAVAGTTNDPLPFSADFAVAVYQVDGAPETTFGTGGKTTKTLSGEDRLNDLAVDIAGRIILAGATRVADAEWKGTLARFQAAPAKTSPVTPVQTLTNRAQGRTRQDGLPSGKVPPQCESLRATAQVVDCYLEHHSDIAKAISWELLVPTPENVLLTWPEWEDWRKGDLRETFQHARAWFAGGRQTYGGMAIVDPPPNLEEPSGDPHMTVLDEDTAAWPIYVTHVAFSLAADIDAWVPWSLRGYKSEHLVELFDSRRFFVRSGFFLGKNLADGYAISGSIAVTPGDPRTLINFLVDNGFIGATPLETVGNILEWGRYNLRHHIGIDSNSQLFAHWQYYGFSPMFTVLAGTTFTNPEPPFHQDTGHFVKGCHGATGFLVRLLQPINIPVDRAFNSCQHSFPHFPTLGLSLPTGDDLFDGWARGSFQAAGLLMPTTEWETWNQSPQACDAPRLTELALHTPDSPALLVVHCQDELNGIPRELGRTFARMSAFFTMEQLERAGFWERLDAVANCGTPTP